MLPRAGRTRNVAWVVGAIGVVSAATWGAGCNGILGTIDLDYGADAAATPQDATAHTDAATPDGPGQDATIPEDGSSRVDQDGGPTESSDATTIFDDAANDTGDASDAAASACPFAGGCPCVEAACAPVALAQFDEVDSMESDSTYLYIAANRRGLVRIPKSSDGGAGNVQTLYAPDGGAAYQVGLTDAGLVVVDENKAGDLFERTLSTSGTNLQTIGAGQLDSETGSGNPLQSANGRIYQLGELAVTSTLPDGGGAISFAPDMGGNELAGFFATPSQLYIVNSDGMFRYAPPSTTLVASTMTIGPQVTYADGDVLYTSGLGGNKLYTMPTDFTTATAPTLISDTYVYAIKTTASFVYWTSDTSVNRCAKPSCQGGSQALLKTSAFYSAYFAVDENAIYYLTNDSPVVLYRVSLH